MDEIRQRLEDIYRRASFVMETAKGESASELAWEFIHNLCMEWEEYREMVFLDENDVAMLRPKE